MKLLTEQTTAAAADAPGKIGKAVRSGLNMIQDRKGVNARVWSAHRYLQFIPEPISMFTAVFFVAKFMKYELFRGWNWNPLGQEKDNVLSPDPAIHCPRLHIEIMSTSKVCFVWGLNRSQLRALRCLGVSQLSILDPFGNFANKSGSTSRIHTWIQLCQSFSMRSCSSRFSDNLNASQWNEIGLKSHSKS